MLIEPAGVQPQQLTLMLDRLLAPPQTPERRAGAHVRPRLEDQPEITGVLDKHAPTHCALAGGDTALKQLARLLKARRRLREQHVAVRTVRPQRERLAREHSASRPGGLPRLVDQILGAVPRLGSVPLGAARDRSEIVLHPNTNTGPAGRRRST